ncbi:helicase [Segetibacter sp. 3557_3]|uniref:primase-helicase family protein n=1 Tax=Segetibacter sp. 3557_3 TaxID=2547429 RepID=UPI0010583E17|nr:primase-helicase family protein [Segetibacter sp. 3557_3]TDH23979.1 helicase [Segetibacter sp. 3557_3]
MSYLRIGTIYYKKVRKPLATGDLVEFLVPWSPECIKQDHGKHFLSSVPRFDGFCLVPGHLDYKREIEDFYNRYHPFVHQPAAGHPTKILVFLNHVFGEQLDIGLDYLKILLLYPMQTLPILCLVSSERNTGKTTFLNFVKAIFCDNMTINSNEDFRSNFNSEWAHKLIIGVDETFLDRKEDSERIKSLSTSKYYKIEAKGQDRQEIEFFGKFILCSNNEDNFIIIDPGEIRYWIRRLPPLQYENTNLLKELKSEIAFFIHYLLERSFTTQRSTRMWFRPDQLATPALKRVKRYNHNKLEVEMAQMLLLILDVKEGVEEICFSLSDIQEWLAKKGLRQDAGTIKNVLQNAWCLKPAGNSLAYLQYKFGPDGNIHEFNAKGRFYSVDQKRVFQLNNLDDFDAGSRSC